MSSRQVSAVLAAAALLVAAAPAVAAPRWSEPQRLSIDGGFYPQVAMDARGNTLVVWWQRVDGQLVNGYRWWLPGRGWTGVRHTPPAVGRATDVGITPLGRASVLVVAASGERAQLAVGGAAAGGPIGDYEPVTSNATNGAGFALGVDDAGNEVVAWGARDADDSVLVATRRAGGRFGAPQKVGDDSAGGAFDVAINPAGAAAVSWMVSGGGRPFVSYRPPGGAFAQEEDPGLGGPGGHRLGIAADGRVVVASDAMSPYVGQPQYDPAAGSSYAIRSPLGGWSEPQSLDQSGFVSSLFVEPAGSITFLIDHREGEPRSSQVRSIRRAPDGTLAGEQLSGPDATTWGLGAMNLRGDVLASWVEGGSVVARERRVGAGAFGPATVLAPGGGSQTASALNDLGHAIVAWDTGGDQRSPPRVEAVVRSDPTLGPLPAPPDVDLYADPLAALDPDGDLLAPVRCSTGCKVSATGIVFGERAVAASGGRSVRLKARRRGRVKLDFGAEGARAVREALAAGERPWVSVTVSGRGKSPRPLVVSRRYKLAR